jgi:biopolymer transport protein ExbD
MTMLLLLLIIMLATTIFHSHYSERVRRSDDASLASLQTTVGQQAAVILTLQAQLTSTVTDLAATKAALQALETKVAVSSTSGETTRGTPISLREYY